MWYHLAAVLGPGDRFATSHTQLDWQYYYDFNSDYVRPSMYMHLFPNAFQIQNTWGWNTSDMMNINSILLSDPVGGLVLGVVSPFTPEPELAELTQQVAAQMVTVIGTFSTANWIAVGMPSASSCPLSQAPSAVAGYLGSFCFQDALAYGLAVFNHFSVSSMTLSTIVTWANTVFAASGHDFTTDAAATCTYTGVPQTLTCSNF